MLEVKNVSYAYTGKYQTNEVLHGVSCSFKPGSMYTIMGPSGSGKTTLLSLLAGLDLPSKGDISFDGNSIASIDRDKYRRSIASVIYQSFNLFPLLTALENVMFPLRMSGKSKTDAENHAKKYISAVNLNDNILKKRPLMMSGGEQQRIAIARALAAEGKILLADEPTGNLDAANGTSIVSILKSLAHEKNYIVVVITHNITIAEQADVIYKIIDGKLEGSI
ncbi:MAG: ATP-binding cassette domain-containing protein [Oscillospiraceae bacterium]|nr:ATP-binding cassette domain-containing protein [Oscillospiraceae bacterium]